MTRPVTEVDFRMPQYRDAKPEEYEFRADGALVRKDRWECAVKSICCLVGLDGFKFEIPDVIQAVRTLANDRDGWVTIAQETPENASQVDIRLSDGSVLNKSIYDARVPCWTWHGTTFSTEVFAWRESLTD